MTADLTAGKIFHPFWTLICMKLEWNLPTITFTSEIVNLKHFCILYSNIAIFSHIEADFHKFRRFSIKKFWTRGSTKRAHLSATAAFYKNRWIHSIQKPMARSFLSSTIYFVNLNKQISIMKNILFQVFISRCMSVGSLQETNIFCDQAFP